jgi:hypothetical protein
MIHKQNMLMAKNEKVTVRTNTKARRIVVRHDDVLTDRNRTVNG